MRRSGVPLSPEQEAAMAHLEAPTIPIPSPYHPRTLCLPCHGPPRDSNADPNPNPTPRILTLILPETQTMMSLKSHKTNDPKPNPDLILALTPTCALCHAEAVEEQRMHLLEAIATGGEG